MDRQGRGYIRERREETEKNMYIRKERRRDKKERGGDRKERVYISGITTFSIFNGQVEFGRWVVVYIHIRYW